MESLDFRSLDWDDSELIAAYNRGITEKKAREEGNKNGFQRKDNKKRKWNIGDNCRAIYSADNSYYEARVISLNGDFCTVEFLGYSDTEDVDLLELKESAGKKARKKQVKEAMALSTIDESEAAGDTTDGTILSYSSYRKKKHHTNPRGNNATFDTTINVHKQYPNPPVTAAAAAYYAPPPPVPTSMPFMAPPATMPQYPVPVAPPMPQCPGLASDPSLSSMLSAWYLAGYYTGMHSAQKENHQCQRCCSHSNRCCRN